MYQNIILIICGLWVLLAFIGAINPSTFFVGFLFVVVALGVLSGQIISDYYKRG